MEAYTCFSYLSILLYNLLSLIQWFAKCEQRTTIISSISNTWEFLEKYKFLEPALWYTMGQATALWLWNPIWHLSVSWLLYFRSSSLQIVWKRQPKVIQVLGPHHSALEGSRQSPRLQPSSLLPLWPLGGWTIRWKISSSLTHSISLSNK